MRFRTPSYYNKFKCIASECTDNCCIGWEIEIDSDTACYYQSLSGAFGNRLKENISKENTFILNNERCPFLNKNNLCDIIISCGETHLCQICRDHPRFFEWYGNLKEGGIGLSCEEAARLILTTDEVEYSICEVAEKPEEVDNSLFELLLSAREYIFSVLDDGNLSFTEKLNTVLDFSQKLQFEIDNPHLIDEANFSNVQKKGNLSQIIELFGSFEPIDNVWTDEYNFLKKSSFNQKIICSLNEKTYLTNIFRYFIYRYFLKGVFDEEILSKVKFAVISVMMIKLMTNGKNDLKTYIEKSKLYSKQMEYSDENRELFYDLSYENDCFDISVMKIIIKTLF